MNILGLDPGRDLFGFGVVKGTPGGCKYVRHGAMEHQFDDEAEICSYVYRYVVHLIKEHNPIAVSMERLFLPAFKNVTFIGIIQCRGAALAACQNYKVKVYSFQPMEIKYAVTGNGKAKKPDVQKAVKEILGLPFVPKPDDAADGLAAAITLRGKLG